MRLQRTFFGTAMFASSLLACQLLIGIEDETGAPEPVPPAAAPDAPPPNDAGCPLLHPPPRGPRVDGGDDGGADTVEYLAIRQYHIRPEGRPPMGYDLDDRCTAHPVGANAPSCIPPADGADAGDDPSGVDNGFGRLMDLLLGQTGVADSLGNSFTASTSKGVNALIFQIAGYNGEENDDHVELGVVDADNLDAHGCGDAAVNEGDPTWDGCDVWNRTRESDRVWIDGRVLVALEGYVVNRRLVARKDDGEFAISLDGTPLTIRSPIVSATIGVNDAGNITLSDGLVAGRVPIDSLLHFAGLFVLREQPICNEDYFTYYIATACQQRDVRVRRGEDSLGRPCDAVSFAMGFDAEKVAKPADPRATPRETDAHFEEICFDASCPE